MLARIWQEEEGVLSFEWTLLVTLLVIGIVSGVTAARDAVIDELGDAAEAMLALDDSYTISYPLQFVIDGQQITGGSDSQFIDGHQFLDCARVTATPGDPNKPIFDVN